MRKKTYIVSFSTSFGFLSALKNAFIWSKSFSLIQKGKLHFKYTFGSRAALQYGKVLSWKGEVCDDSSIRY